MVNLFSIIRSLLFLCSIQLSILSYGGGFTVDLIHRDSAISPLYRGPKTKSDRLKEAFYRSHSRAAYLSGARSRFIVDWNTAYSKNKLGAIPKGVLTEYLIKLSFGTPPTPIYLLIDTASDLTWTSCYKQNYPFFDPKKSSTYQPLPCKTPTCQESHVAFKSFCGRANDFCKFHVGYADGSGTDGDLAFETFTFGSTAFPNLFFGCGQNDNGLFNNTTTGIMGLGPGKESFAKQLGGSIHGKFSHCFVEYNPESNVTGWFSFGDEAVVSGPGIVSTPFIQSPDNYYQLTLESVSIGNKTFLLPMNSTTSQNGNVLIDSGTTLTALPQPLVDNLEGELKQVINVKPVPDPSGIFNLCYNTTSDQIVVPDVTFNFAGAELKLSQSQTFVEYYGGLVCFGIVQSYDGFYIFGNQQQVNLLVGYDLENNQLSFKPTNCAVPPKFA